MGSKSKNKAKNKAKKQSKPAKVATGVVNPPPTTTDVEDVEAPSPGEPNVSASVPNEQGIVEIGGEPPKDASSQPELAANVESQSDPVTAEAGEVISSSLSEPSTSSPSENNVDGSDDLPVGSANQVEDDVSKSNEGVSKPENLATEVLGSEERESESAAPRAEAPQTKEPLVDSSNGPELPTTSTELDPAQTGDAELVPDSSDDPGLSVHPSETSVIERRNSASVLQEPYGDKKPVTSTKEPLASTDKEALSVNTSAAEDTTTPAEGGSDADDADDFYASLSSGATKPVSESAAVADDVLEQEASDSHDFYQSLHQHSDQPQKLESSDRTVDDFYESLKQGAADKNSSEEPVVEEKQHQTSEQSHIPDHEHTHTFEESEPKKSEEGPKIQLPSDLTSEKFDDENDDADGFYASLNQSKETPQRAPHSPLEQRVDKLDLEDGDESFYAAINTSKANAPQKSTTKDGAVEPSQPEKLSLDLDDDDMLLDDEDDGDLLPDDEADHVDPSLGEIPGASNGGTLATLNFLEEDDDLLSDEDEGAEFAAELNSAEPAKQSLGQPLDLSAADSSPKLSNHRSRPSLTDFQTDRKSFDLPMDFIPQRARPHAPRVVSRTGTPHDMAPVPPPSVSASNSPRNSVPGASVLPPPKAAAPPPRTTSRASVSSGASKYTPAGGSTPLVPPPDASSSADFTPSLSPRFIDESPQVPQPNSKPVEPPNRASNPDPFGFPGMQDISAKKRPTRVFTPQNQPQPPLGQTPPPAPYSPARNGPAVPPPGGAVPPPSARRAPPVRAPPRVQRSSSYTPSNAATINVTPASNMPPASEIPQGAPHGESSAHFAPPNAVASGGSMPAHPMIQPHMGLAPSQVTPELQFQAFPQAQPQIPITAQAVPSQGVPQGPPQASQRAAPGRKSSWQVPQSAPVAQGTESISQSLVPPPVTVESITFSWTLAPQVVNTMPLPLLGPKGPLKNKSKDLEKWIDERTSDLIRGDTEMPGALLYKVMKPLVTISDATKRVEAVKTVLKYYHTDLRMNNSVPDNIVETNVSGIYGKLTAGDREEAMKIALDSKAYAHALLIAHTLGEKEWHLAVDEFVAEDARKTAAPLAFIYRALGAETPEAARSAISELKQRGVTSHIDIAKLEANLRHWANMVSALYNVSSKVSAAALQELGLLLASRGYMEQAQVCFLLTNTPVTSIPEFSMPLTSNLDSKTHENIDGVPKYAFDCYVLAELSEYTLGRGMPALLPHKLRFAEYLAGYGFWNEALKVAETVSSVLKSTKNAPPQLVEASAHIVERCQQNATPPAEGWLQRKLSRPNLEKAWVSSFNKFVSGEDETDNTERSNTNIPPNTELPVPPNPANPLVNTFNGSSPYAQYGGAAPMRPLSASGPPNHSSSFDLPLPQRQSYTPGPDTGAFMPMSPSYVRPKSTAGSRPAPLTETEEEYTGNDTISGSYSYSQDSSGSGSIDGPGKQAFAPYVSQGPYVPQPAFVPPSHAQAPLAPQTPQNFSSQMYAPSQKASSQQGVADYIPSQVYPPSQAPHPNPDPGVQGYPHYASSYERTTDSSQFVRPPSQGYAGQPNEYTTGIPYQQQNQMYTQQGYPQQQLQQPVYGQPGGPAQEEVPAQTASQQAAVTQSKYAPLAPSVTEAMQPNQQEATPSQHKSTREESEKEKPKDESKEEPKKEEGSKRGWFGWLKKEDPKEKKVHNVKLGESAKVYYDKELGRWLKEGDPRPEPSKGPPPPPKTKAAAASVAPSAPASSVTPVAPAPPSLQPSQAFQTTPGAGVPGSQMHIPSPGVAPPSGGMPPNVSLSAGPSPTSVPSANSMPSKPKPGATGGFDDIVAAAATAGRGKRRPARSRYVGTDESGMPQGMS